MEIKITGAEKSTYWYAGLVGKTFKVIRRAGDEHGYKVAHHDPADPPETGCYVGESDCVIVSEVPANITALKDESLGGIEREYREVKRKANVGERIVFDSDRPGVTEGKPYGVIGGDHDGAEFFDDDGTRRWQNHVRANCFVLEPTDIIRIKAPNGDGEAARFRMVDRKAAVGERVVVTGERATFEIGEVFVVEDVDWAYPAAGLRNGYNAIDGHYRVLEPVESVEAAEPLSAKPAPDQAAEIIAKLTTRVASLEKRVAALETPAEVTDEDVAEISRIALDPPVFSGVSKLSRVKSPQEIRDDIVKRAKEDVEKLSVSRVENVPTLSGVRAVFRMGMTSFLDTVRFEVNADKRTVVALLLTHDGYVWARGIAKCAPGDVFNAHIGRAIALRRALGLEVPAEYFEAPNPTEVRVGDVVKATGSSSFARGSIGPVEGFADEGVLYRNNIESWRKDGCVWAFEHDLSVIDDSRMGEDESDSAEPRKEVA